MSKPFLWIIGIIALVGVAGFLPLFVSCSNYAREDGCGKVNFWTIAIPYLEQRDSLSPSNIPPVSVQGLDPGQETYRNDTYDFNFQHSKEVIVETWEAKSQFDKLFFGAPKEPLLVIRNRFDRVLFRVSVVDFFETRVEGLFLRSPSEFGYQKCAVPFYGNASILSAKTSFGDGFDSTQFYIFPTERGEGLMIETYRTEYPESHGYTEADRNAEAARIALEEQILKTFRFSDGDAGKSFACGS